MRRRLKKAPAVSTRDDTDAEGFIIVVAGYGYQNRRPGAAPAWGPIADATKYPTRAAADKEVKELRRFCPYPTLEILPV